jgi:hypothetical protein
MRVRVSRDREGIGREEGEGEERGETWRRKGNEN